MRLALNLHVGRYPGRFLRQNIGPQGPELLVLKAPWVLTWNFWPPRHPAGGGGRKRTWRRRRQAADRPSGLPRCCHRLGHPT